MRRSRARAVKDATERVTERVKQGVWDWLTTGSWKSLGAMLVAVIVLGTVGFMAFGKLGPIDALYMAVITMTAVGFGDLTSGSAAHLFAVFYALLGVAVVSLTLSRLAAAMVEGRIERVLGRRRVEQKIEALQDHIVLCGFGRIGEMTATQITEAGIPLVVIDTDEKVIQHAEDHDVLGLAADATEEETLLRAGLERASALLCALASDADNVYTILTAREIRPDIRIVALARDHSAERKLRSAGANQVVSPFSIGARHMARQIISPHVAQVMSTATQSGGAGKMHGMQMEELRIGKTSILDGVTLRDSPIRSDFGVIVVAIVEADGKTRFNPSPDFKIRAGHVLVGVGSPDALARLQKACTTRAS
jgi:voltage-gated potassium channel